MAQPQTIYTGTTGSTPTSVERVYWNGTGTLLTGSILTYDLSAGDRIVDRPATADLDVPAGIYLGKQGGSITTAQWIDIVPIDAYGEVVDVLVAADVYGANDAVACANDSYVGVIPQTTTPADVTGSAGRAIAGFIGFAVGADQTVGTGGGLAKIMLAVR